MKYQLQHREILTLCNYVSITGNWMKFDDDVVSSVPPEEVLKLSGGGVVRSHDLSCDPLLLPTGDWHMAYILIYGPERLEVMNEEEPVSS